MRKLRIAFFVTSEMPFPIPDEIRSPFAPLMIALEIAEGLGKRGHEIVFFGPQESKGNDYIKALPSEFMSLSRNTVYSGTPLLEEGRARIQMVSDTYIIQDIFSEHKKQPFDIINIYSPVAALPIAKNFPEARIVYTLQNLTFPWQRVAYLTFESPNHCFVSCSNNQRTAAPELNYVSTVYNGVDTRVFSYSEDHDNYLLFVGRLLRKKGVLEAIQVARMLEKRLIIIGSSIAEPQWWNESVRPLLGGNIEYLGYKSHSDLPSYYQKAEAFLMPILWEEPFGRVMIEAMSCGTPVVAFNRGAVPEVVEDETTGFVVRNVGEMADAVNRIGSISRKACRLHVEKNFDLEKIVSDYENLFVELREGGHAASE